VQCNAVKRSGHLGVTTQCRWSPRISVGARIVSGAGPLLFGFFC